MKTIDSTHINKSTWTRGPWDHEPDKRQWRDEATGLPCLIVRGPAGALCGYVGVPVGHRAYEVNYGRLYSLDAHGGLTYSDHCSPDGHICHVVEEGDDDHVWWLGFDCAHAGDKSPAIEGFLSGRHGTYRAIEYVTAHVEGLAEQLKEDRYAVTETNHDT